MIIENLKNYGADVDTAIENFDYDEESYISAARALLKNKNYIELFDLVKIKSYDSIFTKAHNFKGACAKLGLSELCAACDGVLSAAKDRDGGLCAERAETLRAEFERYAAAVK